MLPTHARRAGSGLSFEGRTVVVTGASAGVGRATARRFARAGARLGLIARDATALEETKAEIESIGGTAQVFAADMADAAAVMKAADALASALGAIDVWVNNAMATVFSPVSELEPDEVRRVTEVTYLGYVHGTLAALKHMRPRDSGTIVQVGSALAYRGIPLQAPYCAAKHAIRGFTESLRCELIHDGSRIGLTEIHLPAVNTPQFDWARARVDGHPSPVPPIFEPEEAADAIVAAAANPRQREYWLGRTTAWVILGNMLAPSLLDRYLASGAVEAQSVHRPGYQHTRDNLFDPEAGLHRTRGSFGHQATSGAAVMSGQTARLAAFVGACAASAAAGFALGGLLRGRNGPERDGSTAGRLAATKRRFLG